LNGFFIAAPASLAGAILVFSVLRLSFKERLRHMSKGNEKWQALEAVIVSGKTLAIGWFSFIMQGRKGSPAHHFDSDVSFASVSWSLPFPSKSLKAH
jgi:hypothetical protein